jgi:hypothetical protein
MLTRNRWKELLLSLAAGQRMVPFGDNRHEVRQLAERIFALRAAEAARREPATPASGRQATCAG